ncbi:MAG: glutamate-cysteine ligase family protein [Desulfobacterales bacterium]
MDENHFISGLSQDFTRRFLEVLAAPLPKEKRTYGFEYEFLPHRPMEIKDLAAVERVLAGFGQRWRGGVFFENGTSAAFEPGGQLEYCSPPLFPHDETAVDDLIDFMLKINERIRQKTGIEYLARGYMPGRKNAPLCLTSDRYVNLHRRLAKSGTRGHEMMKGTASIHLHVAICSMEEVLPLFYRLCELSGDEMFKMSEVRRDIWNHTDNTRCGVPPCCSEPMVDPSVLIDRLVRFGLNAVVLGEEKPFYLASDSSFEAFLYHITTIFTDVRFNLKGTTFELRTPDSIPPQEFKPIWRRFISLTDNIC